MEEAGREPAVVAVARGHPLFPFHLSLSNLKHFFFFLYVSFPGMGFK